MSKRSERTAKTDRDELALAALLSGLSTCEAAVVAGYAPTGLYAQGLDDGWRLYAHPFPSPFYMRGFEVGVTAVAITQPALLAYMWNGKSTLRDYASMVVDELDNPIKREVLNQLSGLQDRITMITDLITRHG